MTLARLFVAGACLVGGDVELGHAQVLVVERGYRADGVAAIVGGRGAGAGPTVVLRSDVELRARLALMAERPERGLGPLTPALLRSALEQIIGEVQIAHEARRVGVDTPSGAQVRAEFARLYAEAGGIANVRRLLRWMGGDLEEVRTLAQRRATVSGFLSANLEGVARVSDAEVDRAFSSREHPFVGRDLEDVRTDLRVWLSRQAVEVAVRRWVAVLSGRTPVTRRASY